MIHLRLNEVFDDWLTGDGIFHYLQAFEMIPWYDKNISDILDIAYHGDHGDRIISPLVRKLLNTDNELTTANKQKLASVIYNLFIDQWSHKWNLLLAEYNPISNYDMTEHEEYDGSNGNTHTDTGTLGTVGSKTNTGTVGDSGSKITTGSIGDSGSNSGSASVYGFNSDTAVDTDENEGSTSNTRTYNNLTETDSNTRTDNLSESTSGTETHNLTNTDAGTNEYERSLTRSGNIGVTTTQQMMQSEIELWQWNFYRAVFKDIDSVLTLKIY